MTRCSRFILCISCLDLGSLSERWKSKDHCLKPGMAAHICNSRTQESERQNQDGLHPGPYPPGPRKEVLSQRDTAAQKSPLNDTRGTANEVLLVLGFFSGRIGEEIHSL